MALTATSRDGVVVAPHHLASEAGRRVLADGGNAIEAMIAAAATIAVVYPHMNSLGGDNFFLISDGGAPLAIDACGAAAGAADAAFYRDQGLTAIPTRGPLAALTVAGAVSGWQLALEESTRRGGNLPLARLFEDAVHHAKNGAPVTGTLYRNCTEKLEELIDIPGFSETFLADGIPIPEGEILRLTALAATYEQLAKVGLDDFYRGDVAAAMATDLERAGSLLVRADLEAHRALTVEALELATSWGTLYNMPPPTQGLASLIILGLFDRLGCDAAEGFDHVHRLVEATKAAFRVRDREITDPAYMNNHAADFLSDQALDAMAGTIKPDHAQRWPDIAEPGDTVWLGAIDGNGLAVSFIQSIYWEFGSAVVLPQTGIVWQNRGTSFSLDSASHNCLMPGRRPFHTIQPAMARLQDGRLMVYGCMGGEGQPQTQAAVFTRHVAFGQELGQAIDAPRWLLGRTWGEDSSNLRIESRFDASVFEALLAAGHQIETVGERDEIMGHAGAIVRASDGTIYGASDRRCDGSAEGV
jgi:gamma-glutamyltranspeptidase/glutathione hydrolase